tara:strand:- start:1527 stop:2513 length:987 start_codon:yes stop_codon:yes gene_type:complete
VPQALQKWNGDVELSEAAVKVLSPIALLTKNALVDSALKHFKSLNSFRKGKTKSCPCCGTKFENDSDRPKLVAENIILIETGEQKKERQKIGSRSRDKQELKKAFQVGEEAKEIAKFFLSESGQDKLILGRRTYTNQARTAQRLLNSGHSRVKLEELVKWCMSQDWSRKRCATLSGCENLLVQFEHETEWSSRERRKEVALSFKKMQRLKESWAKQEDIGTLLMSRRGVLQLIKAGKEIPKEANKFSWITHIVSAHSMLEANQEYSCYLVDSFEDLAKLVNDTEPNTPVRVLNGEIKPSEERVKVMRTRHFALQRQGFSFDFNDGLFL